jgi:hypothetical protein
MNEEKSLDEALDEMDKWGEQVYEAIKDLSPDEVIEYFRQARSRLEKKTGIRLNLPVQSAPPRMRRRKTKTPNVS